MKMTVAVGVVTKVDKADLTKKKWYNIMKI